MSSIQTVRSIVGGVYVWLAAVFFGATLLDVVYSSKIGDVSGPAVHAAFGEVSDFLLLLGAPTLVTALAAIVASWDAARARNLFIVSIVALSVEFIVPIVLMPSVKSAPAASPSGFGPYLRLIPLLVASLSSLAAFCLMPRRPMDPNS